MAVIDQQQPFAIRVRLPYLGGLLGQPKAGHQIGDKRQPVPENLSGNSGHVWQIGQRQKWRRMGMIDVFMRQPGVQQGFDRGVGCSGIDQGRALDIHHILVRQCRQTA